MRCRRRTICVHIIKVGTQSSVLNIQWNLSNTDTLGTKVIVLIIEVSVFQGDKVGTRSSVLINQVSLFQRCPVSGVPLYPNKLISTGQM